MATVSLTTTPTQIDDGTAASLYVVNSAPVDVNVYRGGSFVIRLRPGGQSTTVTPEGAAVTAALTSGTGSIDVTTTAKPTPPSSGGGGLTGSGGGAVTTTSQVASDAAVVSTYGDGSDQFLRNDGNWDIQTVTASDTATGLPTAGTIRWKSGKTGSFTGTITSGDYSGWVVTWVNGATTKTVTATGITYNASGNRLGPTSVVVS